MESGFEENQKVDTDVVGQNTAAKIDTQFPGAVCAFIKHIVDVLQLNVYLNPLACKNLYLHMFDKVETTFC